MLHRGKQRQSPALASKKLTITLLLLILHGLVMNGDPAYGHDLSSLFRPHDAELALTKREKADCSQQLAEVQEHIRHLQLREQSLKTRLSRCDAVLAPIRRVPDDVLCEVFAQTLPPEKNIPLKLSQSQAPLLLMHVCRRWRMVAMACSSLWKYIHVRVPENTVEGVARVRHMAEILAQSATPSLFNLRITWSSSRFLSGDFFVRMGQTITGLGLHSIPIVNLISLPSGVFPRLERLVISCSRKAGWEAFRELYSIEAFNGSPCLRQVALRDWFYEGKADCGTIRIALPWAQLTHLHIQETIYRAKVEAVEYSFTHHLPRSNNLRYLRFTIPSDVSDTTWTQLPTIRLPNLEGLCMGMESYEEGFLRFLPKMDFPNLKFLRLEGEEATGDGDGMLQTGSLSLGSLVHLSLHFNEMSRWTFRSILECAPNVEVLDLDVGSTDIPGDHVLEQLEWTSTPDARVLPRLRSLILRPWVFEFDSETIGDDLIRVIRSRMNRALPEERLSKVAVYTYTEESVNQDLVREYVDRGTLVFEEHLAKTSREFLFAWMKDNDCFLHDWFELQY